MDVPPGFALACKRCGYLPPAGITIGVLKAHMTTEHGDGPDDSVPLDIVWIGPGECPDSRWQQCPEPGCYRDVREHGEHWLQ